MFLSKQIATQPETQVILIRLKRLTLSAYPISTGYN